MISKKPGGEWTEMSTGKKVCFFVKNITVEPMMFSHVVAVVFAGLATLKLNMDKACRVNLNFSEEVCSALEERRTENFTSQEKEVQQLIASMSIWSALLRNSFPALLVFFLGSWSDRHRKRKPFMLIPICGEFISSVGLIFCVYYFYELPLEFAVFVESFFPSITGGWMAIFVAVYSYIGDISTIEMRTVRIGFLSMCSSLGNPIGMALSGLALKYIGFYGVYSISAIVNVSTFTYCALRVKDTLSMVSEPHKSTSVPAVETTVLPDKDQWRFVHFLKDFFDIRRLKDTFSVLVKRRKGHRRLQIFLLILVHIVVYGSLQGENTVLYLYLRYRFKWDETQFSMLYAYNSVVHIVGNSLSVIMFSHILKFDDALIGIISCISKILADCMMAFAQHEWQIYLASIIAMANASTIAMRSIASKVVPPEELGKLNSVYETFGALVPFLYGPLYGVVYKWTLDTFPGAFMLVGAGLLVPAVLIFWWMYVQSVGEKKEDPETDVPSEHKSDSSGITKDNKDNKAEDIGYINSAFRDESSYST